MARAIALLLGRLTGAVATWTTTAAVALAEGVTEVESELETHEGHHALDLPSILTSTEFLASVENVAILGFLLWWFGRKPIAEFLGKRRREMEVAMKEAAAMKAKAEARYNEYSERLAQLDDELAKLKADIARGAEEDRKRILADAEEATARMHKETEALVDQHAQALSSRLREHVVEAATETAREVLLSGIAESDQQRLAENFRAHVAQHRGRASAPSPDGAPRVQPEAAAVDPASRRVGP